MSDPTEPCGCGQGAHLFSREALESGGVQMKSYDTPEGWSYALVCPECLDAVFY